MKATETAMNEKESIDFSNFDINTVLSGVEQSPNLVTKCAFFIVTRSAV